MSDAIRPLHLVPDIARHGVTAYARAVAAACGCGVSADAAGGLGGSGGPVHVHFTERLWGSSPEAAATRVAELARRRPLSVSLHDLPQASDGPQSERRRARAYAQVIDAARAVACNSRWEAQLIGAFTEPRHPPRVIPLAVWPPGKSASASSSASASAWASAPASPGRSVPASAVIGLLGFIYPGKGHVEAIDAAAACTAALGREVGVLALGSVSDGHAADAAALGERARSLGVSFTVTGYLSDAALLERAREVTVPLAAHQHVSASASIGSWLSAGRSPLVADSAYAREVDALRPGTIRRYAPDRLVEAVLAALADPPAGWLSPGADLRPGPAETADAYLEWWTREVPW